MRVGIIYEFCVTKLNMLLLSFLFLLPTLIMGEEIEFYETVPGGLAIASSAVSFIIVIYVTIMKRINANAN